MERTYEATKELEEFGELLGDIVNYTDYAEQSPYNEVRIDLINSASGQLERFKNRVLNVDNEKRREDYGELLAFALDEFTKRVGQINGNGGMSE